jgi:CBS domain-containing protein
MREYSPLTLVPLGPRARLAEPMAPGRVTLDDPAFSVMTDLREVSAATTTADETLAEAEARMVRRGVRLLFVLDTERRLTGIITATDLLGEKPMRFMQARGISRAEVQVGDLMTPAASLEALSVMDVAQMRVGHIVATFKAGGRRHLTVAEDNGQRVRGLFSASQVARQLGVELQTMEVAKTFADIEAALVR